VESDNSARRRSAAVLSLESSEAFGRFRHVGVDAEGLFVAGDGDGSVRFAAMQI
jgi:hypothetical protein